MKGLNIYAVTCQPLDLSELGYELSLDNKILTKDITLPYGCILVDTAIRKVVDNYVSKYKEDEALEKILTFGFDMEKSYLESGEENYDIKVNKKVYEYFSKWKLIVDFNEKNPKVSICYDKETFIKTSEARLLNTFCKEEIDLLKDFNYLKPMISLVKTKSDKEEVC